MNSFIENEKQLEALAQRIRDLWVAEYRAFELRTKGKATNWGSGHIVKWDGGKTHDGRTHDAIWPKIARHVLKHNLEPNVLVHALFWRKVNAPPTPNQATGPYGLEKYNEYVAPSTRMEIKTEIIHSFESQKQRVAADVFAKKTYYKLDEATAWRIAVGTKTTPLTPLFRYCVARNQDWNDIAEEYVTPAKSQYVRFAEIYDEVYGDWIPADFKGR